MLVGIKPNGSVSTSECIPNPVRTPGFHSGVFPSFSILVFHLFIHSHSVFSTLQYPFYRDTEVYVDDWLWLQGQNQHKTTTKLI